MVGSDTQLTIPAVMEKIEEACEFVNLRARKAGLREDAVYHCHLSVEEALTNIIEHGYRFHGDGQVIDLVVSNTPDTFAVTIIDDASKFNPLSLPEPDPSTPLMEREGGGWGVFFLRKFMDRVAYSYDGNRNHLRMEKRIKV
jgi:anti-sigma regulatory factor (Ser/Thr protein kinase)